MLQKPRMPQIQGVKGEAVLRYCEPLRTQEMRHHTAFPTGKKQGHFLSKQDYTYGEFKINYVSVLKSKRVLGQINFGPVFYATFGFTFL